MVLVAPVPSAAFTPEDGDSPVEPVRLGAGKTCQDHPVILDFRMDLAEVQHVAISFGHQIDREQASRPNRPGQLAQCLCDLCARVQIVKYAPRGHHSIQLGQSAVLARVQAGRQPYNIELRTWLVVAREPDHRRRCITPRTAKPAARNWRASKPLPQPTSRTLAPAARRSIRLSMLPATARRQTRAILLRTGPWVGPSGCAKDDVASLSGLEDAVALSPSFAMAHYTRGFVEVQTGDAAAAVLASDFARQLSPFDSMLYAMCCVRAFALVRLGRYEEAAEWATRAARKTNAQVQAHGLSALILAIAGKLEDALREVGVVRRLRPNCTIDDFFFSYRVAGSEKRAYRIAARRIGISGADQTLQGGPGLWPAPESQVRFKKSTPMIRLLRVTKAPRTFFDSAAALLTPPVA